MSSGVSDWLNRLLGKHGAEPPAWYQFYGWLHQAPPGPKTPVDQLRFTILDVETTGLNTRQDRLLSIGALRIHDRKIILEDALELYLDPPEGRKKTRAITIHGLLPGSKNRSYLEEENAIRKLLDFIGNDILVGHHLGFDIAILNTSLERLDAPKLQNTIVDTAKLAERLYPNSYPPRPDQYQLDHLCRKHNIPLSDRHTALGDCFITGVLLLKLLHGLEDRKRRKLMLGDLR
ncbi:MAG: 3'-5' exonuclease [Bacteroidota bacterium]